MIASDSEKESGPEEPVDSKRHGRFQIQGIIDRFEGEVAVVELVDKSMHDLPRAFVPDAAVEGDVLSITIDAGETKTRKKRIKKLMDDLFD